MLVLSSFNLLLTLNMMYCSQLTSCTSSLMHSLIVNHGQLARPFPWMTTCMGSLLDKTADAEKYFVATI